MTWRLFIFVKERNTKKTSRVRWKEQDLIHPVEGVMIDELERYWEKESRIRNSSTFMDFVASDYWV